MAAFWSLVQAQILNAQQGAPSAGPVESTQPVSGGKPTQAEPSPETQPDNSSRSTAPSTAGRTLGALATKYAYAPDHDALTNVFREFRPDITTRGLHRHP